MYPFPPYPVSDYFIPPPSQEDREGRGRHSYDSFFSFIYTKIHSVEFEFIVIDSRDLAGVSPDPRPFKEKFSDLSIASFPNLGTHLFLLTSPLPISSTYYPPIQICSLFSPLFSDDRCFRFHHYAIPPPALLCVHSPLVSSTNVLYSSFSFSILISGKNAILVVPKALPDVQQHAYTHILSTLFVC